MRKINEIFYSLQGEGFHTGTPAVFVRFSGCNLKCPFCDTHHEDGVLMTDGPLKGLLARSVVVIDGDGKVVYTELVPEITQEPDYDKALAAVKR